MMETPQFMLPSDVVASVTVSSELLERIVAQAEATPAVEVCGLIFGATNLIEGIGPCANVASDPATRFEIDSASLLTAHRHARSGGPSIIGHYHSHPSGRPVPSQCDAMMAEPDNALWLIVAACDVRAWRAVVEGQVHGRFDPVALIVAPCATASASPKTGDN